MYSDFLRVLKAILRLNAKWFMQCATIENQQGHIYAENWKFICLRWVRIRMVKILKNGALNLAWKFLVFLRVILGTSLNIWASLNLAKALKCKETWLRPQSCIFHVVWAALKKLSGVTYRISANRASAFLLKIWIFWLCTMVIYWRNLSKIKVFSDNFPL